MSARWVLSLALVVLPLVRPGVAAGEEVGLSGLVAAMDREAIAARGPGVMDELVALYRTAGEEERQRIASLFYDLGWKSEAAREALMVDLGTSNERLRVTVQWALGRVSNDDSVVEALLERMVEDPVHLFRDKAACGLAHDQIHLTGEQRRRLLERLVDLLDSRNDETRRLAAQVLRVRTGTLRGYHPAAPLEVREAAIARWRGWLERWGSPAASLARTVPVAARVDVDSPVFTPLSALGGEQPVATGPDTFRVVEEARGRVERTPLFRFSGDHSVEIRDVPGDGDFPELQGSFATQRTGVLFFHFAFLVADPGEAWNVALAGPAGFAVVPDGIAFWLEGRDGELFHVSDGQPRSLLRLEPFTWYQVDLLYDVERGRYDLAIQPEGRPEPMVAVSARPNAPGTRGSAVSLFSFIGDTGHDASAVVYYVDDVAVAALAAVENPPLVAPGRRELFVERFGDHRDVEARLFLCLPPLAVSDLGPAARNLSAPAATAVSKALAGEGPAGEVADPAVADLLARIAVWRTGCALLGRGEVDVAASSFERLRAEAPGTPLFDLASVSALARSGDLEGAARRLGEVRLGAHDPRPTAFRVMLEIARGDPTSARLEVAALPALPAPEDRSDPVVPVGAAASVARSLATDLGYLVRVLVGDLADAVRFALEQASLPGPGAATWRERAADAALLAGDAETAAATYRALDADHGPRPVRSLKLADALWLLGDLAGERRLREEVYGSLEP